MTGRWRDRLFGKAASPAPNPVADLASDPRWRRLHDRTWTCPVCNETHAGLFDLAFNRPDPWTGPEDHEPNNAIPDALGQGRDCLTEDICLLGSHRILRCVLPLPVIGSDETFAFGVWATIKPEYFSNYLEHFDTATVPPDGPYFSWLMNRLPGASTQPPKCEMTMQPNRQRPVLTLQDPENPFFEAQRNGIAFDAILDLYARFGHDIRPHLLDG